MPICERCNAETEADEIREHLGQSVCEDCYMDLLNPPKSCDPWPCTLRRGSRTGRC